MPTLEFTKTHMGLIPADQKAADWFHKQKSGTPISILVSAPRNGGFHRKFFAMLNVAYENHDWPEISTKYGMARCSQDMFRSYVIVKAGHYNVELTPTGEVRATPKSIAFGNMEQDEFERLYSDVLDIILQEFLTGWSDDDMRKAVEQIITFA